MWRSKPTRSLPSLALSLDAPVLGGSRCDGVWRGDFFLAAKVDKKKPAQAVGATKRRFRGFVIDILRELQESPEEITQPTMGDAEAGSALPAQVAVESEGGAEEEVGDRVDQKVDANHEEPSGNTAIEDDAPVGESQLDSETPDAADSEGGDGIDGTKTNGELGAKQDHGDIANEGGATAESGVEVADANAENTSMYRRVRELALEAINAVR